MFLNKFQNEIHYYKFMSRKSVEIAKSYDNESKLVNIIDTL